MAIQQASKRMEKIEEKSVYRTKEKLDGGEKKRKNNVCRCKLSRQQHQTDEKIRKKKQRKRKAEENE